MNKTKIYVLISLLFGSEYIFADNIANASSQTTIRLGNQNLLKLNIFYRILKA